MQAPELLAPAGSPDIMRAAFDFGADAVYAGLPRYSLRVRNNEFRDVLTLSTSIAEAHARGKKFFVVANVLPHPGKTTSFVRDMSPIVALKPDALIMADPGLIDLARNAWPDMPIHLSVQANTLNAASVKFWHRIGITRIILSRELSLDEVASIRQECPETELEVFVHGALCIAYSGRCLLSGYFTRRDSNQGACTNSCRWKYQLHTQQADPDSDPFLLEESERPGELMPIEEDEHGTYILNSKDLRAVEHIQRLVEIGIDSLKIEGRTKSAYYVGRVCQSYRRAIDDAVAGTPFNPALLEELEGLANRGYTSGFYQRSLPSLHQNYVTGGSRTHGTRYTARVIGWAPERQLLQVQVKNRFNLGDTVELITPTGNSRHRINTIQDADGNPLTSAPGDPHRVWLDLPSAPVGSFLAKIDSPPTDHATPAG